MPSTLRAAPPAFPAPSYIFPVPMHAGAVVAVSLHPEGERMEVEPKDGRGARVMRRTAHRPVDGLGAAQLVGEALGSVAMGREDDYWRLRRKSELVVVPTLAPGKDGIPIPCQITALDVVPEHGWIGFIRHTTNRWRLTCAPVARPKRRKDADPWFIYLKLTGAGHGFS